MPQPRPAEIRQARAFLGKKKKVAPKKFAQASKELGKSFAETMKIIRAMIAAGTGRTPPTQSPIAQDIAERQGAT
jgi:hypothetical protein